MTSQVNNKSLIVVIGVFLTGFLFLILFSNQWLKNKENQPLPEPVPAAVVMPAQTQPKPAQSVSAAEQTVLPQTQSNAPTDIAVNTQKLGQKIIYEMPLTDKILVQ